jgi:hypothetical protein
LFYQLSILIAAELSWAVSHVRWLKADETSVLRTICALVLREITSVP